MPTLAHSSADVRVNGGCAPGSVPFRLRFFHIGRILSLLISRQLLFFPIKFPGARTLNRISQLVESLEDFRVERLPG
jgi:hypothetical protein